MQMIQKQIQTNTNIAKNRLAKKSHFDPNESIGLGLSPKSAQKKIIGNKTFYKQSTTRKNKFH